MRSAIDKATGPNGLDPHQSMDLDNHLDKVDRALDQHDAKAARDEAKKLSMQVDDLGRKKGFDPQTAERLRTAADRLVRAVNDLSG